MKNLKEILLKTLYVLINWLKSGYFSLILIMFFSLWGFIYIAINIVLKDKIVYYDQLIVDYMTGIASPPFTKIISLITQFGAEFVIFFLLVSILSFFMSKHFREGFLTFIATAGGYMLVIFAKDIFDRARPVVSTPIAQTFGYSFPSGHAITSICFYGALIYLTFVYLKNIWAKAIIIVLLTLLILAVGLSRVYLGVHYPSDVLGGYLLGLFWLSLCVLVYRISLNK